MQFDGNAIDAVRAHALPERGLAMVPEGRGVFARMTIRENLQMGAYVRDDPAQVEAQFGAPAERYAAVGQPPITRWVYPAFVVYFEYQHVVHTVARRTAAAQP